MRDQRLVSVVILTGIFKAIPKWKYDTEFVGVRMDSCIVYIPCSDVKEGHELQFAKELSKLYQLTKNKA